jgi:hypothetical protein
MGLSGVADGILESPVFLKWRREESMVKLFTERLLQIW